MRAAGQASRPARGSARPAGQAPQRASAAGGPAPVWFAGCWRRHVPAQAPSASPPLSRSRFVLSLAHSFAAAPRCTILHASSRGIDRVPALAHFSPAGPGGPAPRCPRHTAFECWSPAPLACACCLRQAAALGARPLLRGSAGAPVCLATLQRPLILAISWRPASLRPPGGGPPCRPVPLFSARRPPRRTVPAPGNLFQGLWCMWRRPAPVLIGVVR